MKRLRGITLLLLMIISISSCAMRSPMEIGRVSNVSFNPIFGSTLGFNIEVQNNLKKDITLKSGTVAVGEEQKIILHVTDPITITPNQKEAKMKFRIEMVDGLNLEALIKLVQEIQEMPLYFDCRVQLGKKTIRVKRRFEINIQEQLGRLKL